MAANDPQVDEAYVAIRADASKLNDEITAATDEEQAKLDRNPLNVAVQPELSGFEVLDTLLRAEQVHIDSMNLTANYQAQLTGVDQLIAEALVAREAVDGIVPDSATTKVGNFEKALRDVLAVDMVGVFNAMGKAATNFFGVFKDFADSKAAERIAAGFQAVGSTLSVLSGLDAVTKNVEQAREAMVSLFTELPQVAAVTLAIVGATGAIIDAAGAAISLAGGLAQALPVLLALPGVAVGATILGIAFGNLRKTMPDVFAELQAFKASIQQDFWSAPVAGIGSVKDAFASFLTFFTGSFGNVATTIGTFMGTLFAALQAVPLASFFDNLSASVLTLQGFMGPLVNTFTEIGTVGSAILPPLAALFGDLVGRFGTWLDQLVTAAGGVQAFAAQTVGALSNIINVITGLGGIFGALFEATQNSGVATVASLANTFSNWSAILHTDDAQATLNGLFTAAHQMFANLGEAIGPPLKAAVGALATTLQGILPTVGTAIGQLGGAIASIITPQSLTGFQAFINGIAGGINAMVPAFAQIAPLIAAVGPDLGNLADLIGHAFGALSPTLSGVFTALNPIINLLGGGLVDVITAVSPAIQQFHDVLQQALQNPALQQALQGLINGILALVPALSPIISLVGTLLATLLPLVATILTPLASIIAPIATFIGTIATALAPLITQLGTMLNAILQPIMAALGPLLAQILPPLAAAIGNVLAALTPIIDVLISLIGILMPILVPVLTFVANLFATALTQAITGVSNILTGFVQVITGVIQFIVGVFTGSWSEVWNGIKNIFEGIWNLILGIFEVAINIGILGEATKVLGIFKGLWGDAWAGIQLAFEFIWNAIKETFTVLMDFFIRKPTDTFAELKTIVSGAWADIIGFFAKAWDTIKLSVQLAWADIKGFFTNGVGDAVNVVKSLPQKAEDGLGDLGRALWNAGTKLIQGFIDGISSMFDSVKNKLGSLTSKLTDWKGPASTDAVLLYDAGQLVIDGFINGLESRYDAVRKSLGGLTDDISGTQIVAPGVTGGLASIAGVVAAAAATATAKTFIYNNYGSTGLSSEEELFAAAGRSRMAW